VMFEEDDGANLQIPPMPDYVAGPTKDLLERADRHASGERGDFRGIAPISPVVRAANTLTARWCTRLGGEDYALSAAGVWPLLALLASAADEPARAELATALGRPADSTQRDALDLLDVLRSGVSTSAAMGIWTRTDTPLNEDWASPLPEGVVGELTDQAALDRWAADQTGGLIDRFPLKITDGTLLMIASALAARVRWRTPFDGYPRGGEFALHEPGQQWLRRTTSDLAAAGVLDAKVTRIVVEGDGDLDVHLLLGDRQPADVLAAGLRELSGEARIRSAADLDHGSGAPGLTVRVEESSNPGDELRLTLPSFEVRTRHDLLTYGDMFGLRSVTDPDKSHLPLLSPVPLYVSRGAQDVLARFFAEGFEAAAVTAFDLECTGAPPPERYRVTAVDVTFDRPFGFLAVHRPSRLAVVAGWVSSPFQPAQVKDMDGRLPTHSIRLSKEEIEGLKAQGYNQSQIAKMFGVSRQAVSWHLKTYGGRLTPRQRANESWPWDTTNAHGKAVPYQRLRDHGEFMATGGRGMSEGKLKRLRNWWRKLREENLVVEFDSNIPPIPGVSPYGGFAYRERVSDDDDLLIRVNEHTRLTKEGEMIWCWPPDLL
jgi:serine protease inhibitor